MHNSVPSHSFLLSLACQHLCTGAEPASARWSQNNVGNVLIHKKIKINKKSTLMAQKSASTMMQTRSNEGAQFASQGQNDFRVDSLPHCQQSSYIKRVEWTFSLTDQTEWWGARARLPSCTRGRLLWSISNSAISVTLLSLSHGFPVVCAEQNAGLRPKHPGPIGRHLGRDSGNAPLIHHSSLQKGLNYSLTNLF